MRGCRVTASIVGSVATPSRAVLLVFLIGSVLLGAALPGCDSAEHDPDRPDGVVLVAPRLDPPPARDGALERDAALRLARRQPDPADAIAELDARRFAFALDDATLAWFGQQGVDPAVLDYLKKRAMIDWESLRGDVDPDGPQ